MVKISYKPMCLDITFNSCLRDMTSIKCYLANQLFHLSVMLVRVMLCEGRIDQCMNLVDPIGSSKEVVGECKY